MTIEFSRPEFHASVLDVRRAAAALTESRARAASDVDALLDSWHGVAAASFAAAWEEWLVASSRVATSLDGLADGLALFLAEVSDVDGVVCASFSALGPS